MLSVLVDLGIIKITSYNEVTKQLQEIYKTLQKHITALQISNSLTTSRIRKEYGATSLICPKSFELLETRKDTLTTT